MPWEEAIVEARISARARWPALPMTHLREAVRALEGHPLAVAEMEAARLFPGRMSL